MPYTEQQLRYTGRSQAECEQLRAILHARFSKIRDDANVKRFFILDDYGVPFECCAKRWFANQLREIDDLVLGNFTRHTIGYFRNEWGRVSTIFVGVDEPVFDTKTFLGFGLETRTIRVHRHRDAVTAFKEHHREVGYFKSLCERAIDAAIFEGTSLQAPN